VNLLLHIFFILAGIHFKNIGMKVNIYMVMALMVCLVGQDAWAQGADREEASEQEYIRCYTTEADLVLRAANPELGTMDDFEERMASWLEKYREKKNSGELRGGSYTIPIVFHIIHNGESAGLGTNVDATFIQAQVDQLNNDFRKVEGTSGDNDDPAGADTEIEFCLALRDPDGNLLDEPGINRIDRNDEGWINPPFSTNFIQNIIKAATVWDSEDYLNIWSANISGNILGYAQFPNNSGLPGLDANNGSPATDGVVILYSSMGSTDVPYPGGAPYNMGRTLTHEIGHYLGLRHIWGDAFCGNDFCDDTPTQVSSSIGNCPSTFTCGSSDMTTNYMDYSNDVCMNIFTFNQKERMQAVISGPRLGLVSSAALVCDPDAAYALFSASSNTACEGSSILFTDNSVGDGFVSWTWDFGDGGSSDQQNPTHIYTTAGTYTVTLTVNDGSQDYIASDEVLITGSDVFDHLNGGALTIVSATCCGGTSGYISGTNDFEDEAKAEYFVEGSEGAILGDVEFFFDRVTTNAANVTFRVWDADGNDGSPGSVLATENVPSGSISTTGATIVNFGQLELNGPFYVGFELTNNAGEDIVVKTNGLGETIPATAWERWDGGTWFPFNDYTMSNTTWEADVALAISAEIECEATQAPVAPVAAFSADATMVCAGNEVNFTDESTNDPTSWLWDFGDGNTSEETNPTHTYADAGDYTVTLTATNNTGSDSEVKTDYISVDPEPVNFAGNASADVICDGETVDLSMSGTFGAPYSWEGPGGVIANSSSTSVTPSVTTTYTAICDDGVCRAESEVTITVNPQPGIPAISSGGGGALSASSSSSGTWQWYLDGNPIDGANASTFTATEDGDYQAEIMDINGCVSISDALSVVLSAVFDEALNAAVELYPNPVSGILTVQFNNYPLNGLSLSLVDVAGRELHTIVADNALMEIDMRSLSAGVYMLKLETDNGSLAVRKVVKQQ
jgi:PKD repeat protein